MVLYTPVVIGWVAESFVDKVAQTSRSPSLVFENNLILVFILGACPQPNDPLNILVFPWVWNLCLLRLSGSSMPVEPHGQKARSRTLENLMLQVAFKLIHYPPFSDVRPTMGFRPAPMGYRRFVGVTTAPIFIHLVAETIGSAYLVSCSAFLTRELDPLKSWTLGTVDWFPYLV